MIFIKKIGLIFLFLISVLIGICLFLLNTNTGIYLICTGIVYFVPGLTFDSISGSYKNFNINHIKYSVSASTINVDRCNIMLNYKYIFDRKIYIDHIFVKDVCVNIKKVDLVNKVIQKNQVVSINNILSFLKIVIVKHIILSNVRIISDNFVITLKEVENTGVVLYRDNLLTVLSTYIKGAIVNIYTKNILNMQVNATSIYRYSNLLGINHILKNLSNKLLVTLPVFNIPLDISAEEIKGQDLCIFDINDDQYKVDNFCLKMFLYDQVVNVHLDLDSSYGQLNIIGNMAFKNNWPINVTVNCFISRNRNSSNNTDQNVKKVNLVITGDILNEICLCCNFISSISTIHILLTTRITQFGIPINISVVGRKIPIPFFKKNRYVIEDINFCLSGEMRDYYVKIISRLSDVKYASKDVIMNARGNIHECIISELKIGTLNEFFVIKGTVNWNNMINWNSVLILHKINILQKCFKYPIELSGIVAIQGQLYPDTWAVTISDVNINGRVRNNRILCTGSVHRNISGQWIVPVLLVKWGSNILKIKGELIKNYAFDIIFKVPNCNAIIPALSGSIYGKFKICGPIKCPVLFSKINLNFLCWNEKDLFINEFIFNSKINCNNSMSSDFFLKIDTIRYGMFSLHKLIAQGEGNAKQHYVNIMAHDNKLCYGKIKFCGNIDFFHEIWRGRIYKTSIITPIGVWTLTQDTNFTYHHLIRKVVIDSHYWESINCCVPICNINKMRALKQIEAIFKHFNMMFLQIDCLPDVIDIRTVRIYCVNCYWIIGTILPRGTILLSGMQLYIKSSNRIETVSKQLNSLNIKIILTKTDVYYQWYSSITNNSQVNGACKINYIYNEPEISGNIQIQNFSLGYFSNLFFQSKEYIVGLLNLNISFCGSMCALNICGSMQLQDVGCNAFDMPVLIKNSKLVINFFRDYATLDGVIQTDHDRYLYLNGNIINLNSIHNMEIILKIKGDQVYFNISPEIQLKISPDIICTITSKKICVQGKIDIPWARIKMQELSKNIADISSEEIILDDNFKPILNNSKNLSLFLFSNIIFHFGNDVIFNGFGLHVKLQGDMIIGYDKNGLMLTGHINIPSGTFMIYGHHLIIKKGQLLFYGQIDQPYLDIEAIRSSSSADAVITGIRITGMLNQLKLEIFPNSSLLLSQQEIVSYLLGGHSIILSHADTNIITSLLIGASVNYNEKFINRIGKIFGVQDLTLNTTQDTGAIPFVTLSGSIAPGLQIKYGIGIFDLLTTITVRYSLNSQLHLEITSGNYQALDLLCQCDF